MKVVEESFVEMRNNKALANCSKAGDSITHGKLRYLSTVGSNDPRVPTTPSSQAVDEDRRFGIEPADQRVATLDHCSHHAPTEQDLVPLG